MSKKRIFMYATHPALVDQESLIFYKHDFDVYTAAWATNTRSLVPDDCIAFNSKHFYQGKCEFLSANDIAVLSKIDIGSRGIVVDPNIQKVLLDNFDVLYVSQVTPWLMAYAEEFLKLGRPVIFRTFGYSLGSWGQPSDYQRLYKYPTFYIVPTDPKEVELDTFKGYPTYQIMAAINKELINLDNTTDDYGKFMLVVFRDSDLVRNSRVKSSIEDIMKLVLVDKSANFITSDELDTLFNSCYLFMDVSSKLLRYSSLEAIMHNKPIIVYSRSDMLQYMIKTGFKSEVKCDFDGYGDLDTLRWCADNPVSMKQLATDEKMWLDRLIVDADNKWDTLIGEMLCQKEV